MSAGPPVGPLIDGAPTAPAGWFPDPSGNPLLRYWDGQRWTEHYAQAGPAVYPRPQKAERSGALAMLGLAMAILMPFIGFLLGLVLLSRRQDKDGLVVVMISIAVFVLWYAVVIGGA